MFGDYKTNNKYNQLPGTDKDLKRMIEIFTNVKYFNYSYNNNVNIMQCDDNGFVCKDNVLLWLENARTMIDQTLLPNYKGIPFDSLIFYASCHGNIDQRLSFFIFIFLFFSFFLFCVMCIFFSACER